MQLQDLARPGSASSVVNAVPVKLSHGMGLFDISPNDKRAKKMSIPRKIAPSNTPNLSKSKNKARMIKAEMANP